MYRTCCSSPRISSLHRSRKLSRCTPLRLWKGPAPPRASPTENTYNSRREKSVDTTAEQQERPEPEAAPTHRHATKGNDDAANGDATPISTNVSGRIRLTTGRIGTPISTSNASEVNGSISHDQTPSPDTRTPRSSSRGSEMNAADLRLDLAPAPSSPSSRFSNRGVILTGGTSGIGFDVLKQLVQSGIGRVLLITRSSERGQQTIAQISKLTSIPADELPITILKQDLSVLPLSDDFNDTIRFFKSCNTLINCAALPQNKPLLTTEPTTVSRILNANLQAPIILASSFLRNYASVLTRRRTSTTKPVDIEGAVPSFVHISVSSVLATRGVLGASTYSASKAGLLGLNNALIAESTAIYRRHNTPDDPKTGVPTFRSNIVMPGYIDTPMLTDGQKQNKKILWQIPINRLGKADEVADAVMWMLGNEYANGCVLTLDGGLSAT